MTKKCSRVSGAWKKSCKGLVPAGSFLNRCVRHRGLVWYILKDEASQRDAENKDGKEGVGRGREAPGFWSCMQQAVCIEMAQMFREEHRCRQCRPHSSALRGSKPEVEMAARVYCPTLGSWDRFW